MDEQQHLERLKQGVSVWNRWRSDHPEVTPRFPRLSVLPKDLRGVDFHGMDLHGVNFLNCDCTNANFERARLTSTSFWGVTLKGANLMEARLDYAHFQKADLSGADLRGADLTSAFLHDVNLTGATLTGCRIYGVSVWDVTLQDTLQKDLLINRREQAVVTVDDIEIAQFLYLLLNNAKIRTVIDTITSKVVLILGRFTPERKVVLDALREELRAHNYLPVLFDFDKPANRDITETVATLAHMARFVIADITDAKSIPQELLQIVPDLPSVPVQPLLLESQNEYGMFEHFRRYPWVLPTVFYKDQPALLAVLKDKVIGPAEAKAREQTGAG